MIRPATRLVAVTAAFGLLAGAAFAQAPAPAAGQPTANHLALAREAAVVSGLTRTYDAIIPQFAERIRQGSVSRPEIVKDLNEVLESLKPEMELQKQQMINTTARVFASRLTEAELKEIVGFFKSPAGQRYVSTQPVVLEDLVKEVRTWTDNVAEYVMVRVRAEMGKRGHMMQ
jgi:hypothetical protein